MRLAGKFVVVTGAGRGIGRQVAQMMAAQGARVLAVDLNAGALASLTGMQTHVADLTDEGAVATLAARVAQQGPVDALVNAAALVVMGWIEDLTYADWQRTLRAEVDSVFLVTRALWPMLKVRGGSIINFSSANAHGALAGLPAVAHTAGKGAVLAMTRQLAMEGGPHRIRANTIAPGFIVTGETERHLDNPVMMDAVRAKLMIDRLGQTDDIGHLAIYLASDESGFVTGADFRIDGGATAW